MLGHMIELILQTASSFEAELEDAQTPVTLVMISDISSISMSKCPRAIQHWADTRIREMIDRLDHASDVIRPCDGDASRSLRLAARRVEAAWDTLSDLEVAG